MKETLLILLLALSFMTSVFAGVYTPQTVPNPKQWGQDNYVSNPDCILERATVDSLNRLAWMLEQATGDVELAIVVLGSYRMNESEEPNQCDLFNFNYDLFNLWGIGKAETNRGLLITVSYDARKMFMSTGTSLESDLTDASCLYIQKHYMLPHFKKGDYDKGLVEGVVAVYGYLTNDKVKSKIIKAAESNGSVSDTVLVIIVVFSIILLAWIVSWFSKDSDGSGGSSSSYSSSSYSSSSSSSSSRGSWGGGSTSGGGAGSSW